MILGIPQITVNIVNPVHGDATIFVTHLYTLYQDTFGSCSKNEMELTKLTSSCTFYIGKN